VYTYLGQDFLADSTEVVVEQPIEERVPEAVAQGQPRYHKVDEWGDLTRDQTISRVRDMGFTL
jgi:hypothetical protein